MAVSTVITTNTTAATKTEGFGSYSFSAETSTLGVGTAVEHTVTWKISAAPAGFTYTTTDQRTGVLNTAINLKNGAWRGWTFAFPLTHAGNYTIRCTIEDADGDLHTAIENVTVAAFTGTTRYLDGNASGTNDGTSPTNAWETLDKAMDSASDIFTMNNIKLLVAGGQGYSKTTNTAQGTLVSNLSIEWDDTGGTKPVIDIAANTFLRFSDGGGAGVTLLENGTIKNLEFKTTSADGNGVVVAAVDDDLVDLCVEGCTLSSTGNMLRAFLDWNPTTATRILLYNNDTSRGVDRYSLCFGAIGQFDIVGNTVGDSAAERAVRINAATSKGTIIYNHMRGGWKENIALQNSTHTTIGFNKLVRFNNGTAGASNSIYVNYNNDKSVHTTIESNEIDIESDSASSMSGIKSTTTTTVAAGMDIMVRNNVVISRGASNTATTLNMSNCDRLFLLNNTVVGSSDNVGVLGGSATTEARVEANIFIYSGPGYSAFNDNIVNLNMPVTDSFTDNDFSVGDANTSQDKHYKVNGTEVTISGLNALGFASGNAEVEITLDSSYLPTPQNTATLPVGSLLDYFVNVVEPGESGFRGAIQALQTNGVVPRTTSRIYYYYTD